jgi:hypothetical protein
MLESSNNNARGYVQLVSKLKYVIFCEAASIEETLKVPWWDQQLCSKTIRLVLFLSMRTFVTV